MTSTSRGPYRICFVTSEYPPDWGGVAKSSRRIVKMLVAEGFDVHVFKPLDPPSPNPLPPTTEIVDGAKLHGIHLSSKGGVNGAAYSFFRAIDLVDQDVKFDLFHGFYLPMAYPCLMVAHRGRRPVIASIRGDDGVVMLKEGPFKQVVAEVLQRVNWVTSVSKSSLDRAMSVADISRRSSFIPNSIDTKLFSRWELTDNNRGVVGTVCTFRRKKNISLLVKSYSGVRRDLRNKLLLVGTFKEKITEKLVFDTINECGVGPEIEITGYLDHADVLQHLPSMHVFVLSSTHEGFPNAVLEAAAAGLPIVATAIDGVKDVFTDSANAILVPSEDHSAMTAAIEAVLSDDDLARHLSDGALALARSLDGEREKREWVGLYHALIA